jgi:glycosyltransferase involved in cell wall biosynthesis
MRVLQVVTLIDPVNSYGGPVRVAANQSAALKARGHDVMIAGSTRGYPNPPGELAGVPLRLFRAYKVVPNSGFAGLTSPGLHRWLLRSAPRFDVVHIHMARDLVTLPASVVVSLRGVPRVVQPHGMITPNSKHMARLLDSCFTRNALASAVAVCYLTNRERGELLGVARTTNLLHLPNGVPESGVRIREKRKVEVLYMARLHRRKRPTAFAQVALALTDKYPDVAWSLVGPDEGEGERVRQLTESPSAHQVSWEGPLPPGKTLARMAAASIYVLPSVDEPYPMSVLEALSLGLPVVITSSCGLAPLVQESNAGFVTDGTIEALRAAVDRLLGDPALRESMSASARELASTRLSMATVTDTLEDIYAHSEVRTRRAASQFDLDEWGNPNAGP